MSINFSFAGSGGGSSSGGLVYRGSYNATTSNPSLINAKKGDFYIVTVGGSLAGVNLNVGDHIVFNTDSADPVLSTYFDVIDNTDAVSSVNSQTGVVNLNLDNLSDVTYTAGAGIDGKVLTYDHANTTWKAEATGGISSVNGDSGPAVTLDTDNISEGSSNLYFTNARFDTQLATKDTDNVSEGSSNLYYTNARFDTQLATKDTDNVSEGSSNLYFTNARADTRADGRISASALNALSDVTYTAGAAIDGKVLTYDHANTTWKAEAATGGISSVNGDTGPAVTLDTDNVSEGSSNLYYTNARFDTQLATKDTDNLSEGSSNLYYTNARFDTQLATKDTDNLSEGSSNLYFTNARADTRADTRISASALNALSDVTYTAGAGIDNYVFTYDHSNTTWKAEELSIIHDLSPSLGANLDLNNFDLVSNSNQNIELAPDGTGKVKIKGNATSGSGEIVLNCEQNSHGISLKGPPHSAAASYTLTFPNDTGSANQVLKGDGNGQLSWTDQAAAGGGFTYSAITSASSPVTGAVDYHYSANTSGGAVTIDLPAIAAGNSGKEIRVKLKTAGNNLILSPNGTDQVEAGGAGTDYILSIQNQSITLVSDGSSNWEII